MKKTGELQKILGVDFDDTLFTSKWPDVGDPIWPVIRHVKMRKRQGWYVILVTCRSTEETLRVAIEAARSVGIEFDAINENHPQQIELYGNDSRKIYCDEYIDDKNVTISSLGWGRE